MTILLLQRICTAFEMTNTPMENGVDHDHGTQQPDR